MADFKAYIEALVKKIHLEQMSPDVQERFKTYTKNNDFIGNMKNWANDVSATVTLDDTAQETAYKAFLAVFENMAENESSLSGSTKKVFNRLFGADKVFNHPEPLANVDAQLQDFATKVLTDDNDTPLTKALEDAPYTLRNFDDNRFDFKAFRKGIKDGKYVTDPKFRRQVIAVVQYLKSYAPDIFPAGSEAAKYQFDQFGLPANSENWFVARYNPGFQFVLPTLVKQLTVDSKFREDFKKYDYAGTISSRVEKGLEKTAYDNPKSDDFVPPVYKDEKRLLQKVEDGAKNFWDNSLRQFSDVLRGTRRYFTPYTQTIIKAFDGIKGKDGKRLRPVDGIKGILENKDKIIAKITETSPNAKKHFEWFADKMDVYSKKMPKAFDGALYNPKQMRALVSRIIIDAVNSGKDSDIEAAKTSMEILSVMKYGIMHSRTVDAIKGELNKDKSGVLSNKDLSWNKYGAIRFVTGAIDKTAKFVLLGTLRVGAAVRNKYMRDATKFKGDMKSIKAAHEQWKKANSADDIDDMLAECNSQIANQDAEITRLTSEKSAKQTALNAEQSNLAAFETAHGGRAALEAEVVAKQMELSKAIQDLQTWAQLLKDDVPEDCEIGSAEFKRYLQVSNPGDYTQYEALENSVLQHKAELEALQQPYADVNKAQAEFQKADNNLAHAEQDKVSLEAQKLNLENEKTAWDAGHPDKYLELMAYWDMLESFGKSHQFTLASKNMRNKFLDNSHGPSKAQQVTEQFLEAYRNKYGMVA